jgi:hypothetical protein
MDWRLQQMKPKFFFFSILFLLATSVFPQDQDFYIFLCFGQSNMEGQGTIETQDKTVDSRFQVMEAVNCSNLRRSMGKWYTATPPLCRCYTGLSPADYFGRTLVDSLPSNIKIGVINVSVAGCKIELFDKDNYQTYAASTESWMKNIIAEYGGNPYGRLVEIAKLAQKDGIIKGILLHQGESNTGDSQWPSKVKKIYNNLMTDLELDPTKVPLLAGEVVNADQGGICASMNSIIAKLPQTVPNSYVISSKGCTDASDNLHFNSAGYRELGKRYAVKMLSILKSQNTDVDEAESILKDSYELNQNYPNPFNPTTVISYQLPKSEYVSLKIYDVLGNEIETIVNEYKQAGNYSVEFRAKSDELSSGIYFYRLTAGNYSESKKMILIK